MTLHSFEFRYYDIMDDRFSTHNTLKSHTKKRKTEKVALFIPCFLCMRMHFRIVTNSSSFFLVLFMKMNEQKKERL